ncbi:beta-ketoacyl synthase N-terminal-like domain-containing protein [uncultured Kordia sp.]|uniref:beta-ketoacyl synthase N-terminal-like domain-containing protein n=1 Tax=uncultured Kordia sp. TaxID=507699 RepID=UPI00260BD362|nr:beta-ketoacyl synthase N-terminal-like domain-containing protein [uncultured Kordia sp.]
MRFLTILAISINTTMMQECISITGMGSISPLGSTLIEIWKNYTNSDNFFNKEKSTEYSAPLSLKAQQEVNVLKESNSKYKNLDNSVLYAIIAARNAIKHANWESENDFGINIGSSRGATALFEKYHQDFLENNQAQTLSSPTTTLGNISSWVGHDLQTNGPQISHSITCSTALHALMNGIAWMQSGMATKFLVGGSEAPLTPFTIAQMKALHIYAKKETEYPCLSLDLEKKRNTMILGEGAAAICLEKGEKSNALAKIRGIGYATEILKHNTSISANGVCFEKSMRMALGNHLPEEIDAIVMHAPGTIKGDLAEYNAIKKIFCNKMPNLTTNKWKIGHTFGASGMLSVELAILMIQHQKFISIPYLDDGKQPAQINKILVNAVGFGGNAVSVLLTRD